MNVVSREVGSTIRCVHKTGSWVFSRLMEVRKSRIRKRAYKARQWGMCKNKELYERIAKKRAKRNKSSSEEKVLGIPDQLRMIAKFLDKSKDLGTFANVSKVFRRSIMPVMHKRKAERKVEMKSYNDLLSFKDYVGKIKGLGNKHPNLVIIVSWEALGWYEKRLLNRVYGRFRTHETSRGFYLYQIPRTHRKGF